MSFRKLLCALAIIFSFISYGKQINSEKLNTEENNKTLTTIFLFEDGKESEVTDYLDSPQRFISISGFEEDLPEIRNLVYLYKLKEKYFCLISLIWCVIGIIIGIFVNSNFRKKR